MEKKVGLNTWSFLPLITKCKKCKDAPNSKEPIHQCKKSHPLQISRKIIQRFGSRPNSKKVSSSLLQDQAFGLDNFILHSQASSSSNYHLQGQVSKTSWSFNMQLLCHIQIHSYPPAAKPSSTSQIEPTRTCNKRHLHIPNHPHTFHNSNQFSIK